MEQTYRSKLKMQKSLGDHIGQLPDEILVDILSLLTMKEAAATSVLSTRWRYLWTYITRWNFDGVSVFPDILRNKELFPLKTEKYVHWVNQVCRSIRAPRIKELRFKFVLDQNYEDVIGKWIVFAMKNGTQSLELALPSFADMVKNSSRKHVVMNSSAKRFDFSYVFRILLKSPCSSFFMKNLQSLSLEYINISESMVAYFLHCPMLEQLSVAHADCLRNLRVCGTLIKLRFLKVFNCCSLENLEISAPNLVSIHYEGKKIGLDIHDVPSLLDLFIGWIDSGVSGGNKNTSVVNLLYSPQQYFYQLKMLTLKSCVIRKNMELPRSLQLTSLRELSLEITGNYCNNVPYIFFLIDASPFLKKLTLQVTFGAYSQKEDFTVPSPHSNLEHMEIVGFRGDPTEIRFIFRMLRAAAVLKRLVLDPKPPAFVESRSDDKIQCARSCIEGLKSFFLKLAPTIDLVVL